MASTPTQTHVVIFPFMAHGHTLPLLDLSKALSLKRIKVTIITTPGNSKSISKNVSSYPSVSLITLPFPTAVDGIPAGCENTAQLPSMDLHLKFVLATKQLEKPFRETLEEMVKSESRPVCVISDFFLGWTLAVCRSLGVPRVVFHGMGVLAMAISKTAWVHKPHLETASSGDQVELPGLNLPFGLTVEELPDTLTLEGEDPLAQVIEEIGKADVNSWGVVVNSFEEMETSHVPSFESFYSSGAKAWCLGPLCLYQNTFDLEKTSYLSWLDEQIMNSVIYVSFGTQADVSDLQLDEVAHGLVDSGFFFVWVVRSETWNVPCELEEKVKERGLIVREFVDQRRILSHRAVGGFFSHCGWNSVLESVSDGVPMLAWPMMAEQNLNAKLIVEGLGAGVKLERVQGCRRAICDGVRELLGGEKGRCARERAQALGRVARRAVQPGGSSYDALTEMIAQLRPT